MLKATPEKIQTKPQPRILRLVVASPSDVQAERDVLPSVIDDVNRYVAADRGLYLVLSRWETDKFPKEGLRWPYKGKPQFEKLVRNHLTNYIRSLT